MVFFFTVLDNSCPCIEIEGHYRANIIIIVIVVTLQANSVGSLRLECDNFKLHANLETNCPIIHFHNYIFNERVNIA